MSNPQQEVRDRSEHLRSIVSLSPASVHSCLVAAKEGHGNTDDAAIAAVAKDFARELTGGGIVHQAGTDFELGAIYGAIAARLLAE